MCGLINESAQAALKSRALLISADNSPADFKPRLRRSAAHEDNEESDMKGNGEKRLKVFEAGVGFNLAPGWACDAVPEPCRLRGLFFF